MNNEHDYEVTVDDRLLAPLLLETLARIKKRGKNKRLTPGQEYRQKVDFNTVECLLNLCGHNLYHIALRL